MKRGEWIIGVRNQSGNAETFATLSEALRYASINREPGKKQYIVLAMDSGETIKVVRYSRNMSRLANIIEILERQK